MSPEEWEQKRKEAAEKESGGKCNGFVLLEKPEFDFQKLVADIKSERNIPLKNLKRFIWMENPSKFYIKIVCKKQLSPIITMDGEGCFSIYKN